LAGAGRGFKPLWQTVQGEFPESFGKNKNTLKMPIQGGGYE